MSENEFDLVQDKLHEIKDKDFSDKLEKKYLNILKYVQKSIFSSIPSKHLSAKIILASLDKDLTFEVSHVINYTDSIYKNYLKIIFSLDDVVIEDVIRNLDDFYFLCVIINHVSTLDNYEKYLFMITDRFYELFNDPDDFFLFSPLEHLIRTFKYISSESIYVDKLKKYL